MKKAFSNTISKINYFPLISCFKTNNSSEKFNLFKSFLVKNYFSYPCPRKLREIVKLSVLEKENKEQIKEIWKEYHQEKSKLISDVVDGKLMNTIKQK